MRLAQSKCWKNTTSQGRQRRFRTQGGDRKPSAVSLEKPSASQDRAVQTARAQVSTGHPAPLKDAQAPLLSRSKCAACIRPQEGRAPVGTGRPRVAGSVTTLPALKNRPSSYTSLTEGMCHSQPEVYRGATWPCLWMLQWGGGSI